MAARTVLGGDRPGRPGGRRRVRCRGCGEHSREISRACRAPGPAPPAGRAGRRPLRRDLVRAPGRGRDHRGVRLVFLPPLRNLDWATVLVLGLFLGMSVIVGAVATQAGRRAAGSEQARGVLADEQAALRRVATLVARQPSPAEVFAAVTEEAGKLLHLDSAHLIVYERDQTATVVGSWNLRGPPMRGRHAGTGGRGQHHRPRVPHATAGPHRRLRASATGLVAENVRSIGVRAAVGVPVLVGGRLWGVMAVGSSRPEPLPADTEMRIGAFTELVATAIANTAARRSWSRLPRSRRRSAASRRWWPKPSRRATSSPRSPPRSLGCSGFRIVGLFRYEREGVGNGDRRGGRGLVLSRPALALPGR